MRLLCLARLLAPPRLNAAHFAAAAFAAALFAGAIGRHRASSATRQLTQSTWLQATALLALRLSNRRATCQGLKQESGHFDTA